MSGIPPQPHSPGARGQRRSFLEECWAEAAPRPSGQQGGSGGNNLESDPPSIVAAPATPDLPPTDGGNKSAANLGAKAELPRYPEEWGEDGEYVYEERLGVALDQGMDISPGSEAETIARREARRVHAGIPADFGQSRTPDIFDAALKAFLPLGGLSFIRSEPRNPNTPGEDANTQKLKDSTP